MKISADKIVFLAILLVAGVLAPTASAQRPARPVAPPPRPVVVAPPVLTQPRLNPPTLVVPRVAVPAAPRVVIPPPVRAESLGDGGGDALCSDEDALAGHCVEVSRLPRCPGDPRCPDPASLNSRP